MVRERGLRYKFCLLSLTGRGLRESAARFGFFLSDITDLDNPERVFALSPEDLTLINPNTGTLPIFRTRRDAELTAGIYRRIPVLWDEGAGAAILGGSSSSACST